MKTTLRSLIPMTAFIMTIFQAEAQDDISSLFKAGFTDLNKVAEGYIRPMGKGFSAGLGTNWYNTAATHKLGGFDLTIGAGGLFVPSADRSFSLSDLQNLKAVNGENVAPSFAGDKNGIKLELLQPEKLSNGDENPYKGQKITEFTTPEGVSKVIPAASVQLAIGLPKGTELAVRLVPTIKVKDLSTNLWGLGLKHNIKQWIPGLKDRHFDLSVMIGCTHFKLDYTFPESSMISPDDLVSGDQEYVDESGASYTGQGFEMSANSLMFNIITSKKLKFFTPYLGAGFTKNTFDFNFTGTYPTLGDPIVSGPNSGKIDIQALNNPVAVSYNTFMPEVTVGFRMKILWVFALHAQYTLQKYPVASAGFGINIR